MSDIFERFFASDRRIAHLAVAWGLATCFIVGIGYLNYKTELARYVIYLNQGTAYGSSFDRPQYPSMLDPIAWSGVLGLIMILGPWVGTKIGAARGRKDAGFWLGFLFPPGWLITAMLPRTAEAQARWEMEIEKCKARMTGERS
jgi:hypothetical protein